MALASEHLIQWADTISAGVARGCHHTTLTGDDIIQEGRLGLLEGLSRIVDSLPDKQQYKYLYKRIRGACLDALQREGRQAAHTEVLTFDPPGKSDSKLIYRLNDMIDALPRRQRIVLRLLLKGYSEREVGDVLGLTGGRIHQIKQEAVIRLSKSQAAPQERT